MFRKMPFVLLALISVIIFFELPLPLKQFLYSISLSIKSVIVTVLPFVIFGLLFKTTAFLATKASKIIVLLLISVCCSNFLSTFLSHYVGMWIYDFNFSMVIPKENVILAEVWYLALPSIVPNNIAMFAGILGGFTGAKFFQNQTKIIAEKIELSVQKLLNAIVYVIPLFVAGFVIKLQMDGVIYVIMKDYATIFAVTACAAFGYILLVYLILNGFRLKDFASNIINILPAAISGFATMSSAASMPLTIIGAENSNKNKGIARFVIPTTVNIHLVGDCFAIPIFAYAILKSFNMPEPSLLHYITFAFYFVIAKFSVAAIPGGGIIVMLPILQNYLGFNAEMMSLITALYILFDPVITCGNVLGNGAFSKTVDKLLPKTKTKIES